MRAALALLADPAVYNFVRKLAWDINLRYQTGFPVQCLPPHISLKQPFDIIDLEGLERYMDELASSIPPFEIELSGLQLVPLESEASEPTGLLWLNVYESLLLRQLHNRVNQELTQRFGSTPAAHDGPEYHFHMTVAIGGQPYEVYQQIYSEFSRRPTPGCFITRMLAMFTYEENFSLEKGYMTYRLAPLSK